MMMMMVSYIYIYMDWQDNSGTIENEELKGFLKDLLELVKKVGRHTKHTQLYITHTITIAWPPRMTTMHRIWPPSRRQLCVAWDTTSMARSRARSSPWYCWLWQKYRQRMSSRWWGQVVEGRHSVSVNANNSNMKKTQQIC